VLSSQLRRMYDEKREPILLFESDLAAYTGDTTVPSPQEQADRFILWVGSHQGGTSGWATTRIEPLAAVVGADVSTDTTGEPSLQWLFRQLDARLFEQDHISTAAELRFRLSMPGWKVYEQLRRRTTSSRTA